MCAIISNSCLPFSFFRQCNLRDISYNFDQCSSVPSRSILSRPQNLPLFARPSPSPNPFWLRFCRIPRGVRKGEEEGVLRWSVNGESEREGQWTGSLLRLTTLFITVDLLPIREMRVRAKWRGPALICLLHLMPSHVHPFSRSDKVKEWARWKTQYLVSC